MIEHIVKGFPEKPYRMVDLCAGIGGIRRAFELADGYRNVLSAEIDDYACQTYKHLYGENPKHDISSSEFKKLIAGTPYDVLLAGFPCQTFSRVGLQEGFENEEKGKVFFHIADIIKQTRPVSFLLENVDHLTTIDKGKTFALILDTLINDLRYHVIGVTCSETGNLEYTARSFVRNSRDFGMPQNRPRTYIVGFDAKRFCAKKLSALPTELPTGRAAPLYDDLNGILEHNVPAKYYMSSGYFETLVRHRERQEAKKYGFGYRIVNEDGIANPIANTLLATGGSGRERNLIYDPRQGIAGQIIAGKKTPLNDRGIRVMTPTEWGRLQGFVNYAFVNENGEDEFSFPDGIPDVQKYKQFGNAVTIPVVEEMVGFMRECLDMLCGNA
jgi:DNA (cytosine-5)-methyltransferase 1